MGFRASSLTPFGQNPSGAAATKIDFDKEGSPTIQMYHGGTIQVNGKVVGRITSWQPSGAYTREGNHVYEVNADTWGVPVDYVPGRTTGYNISFTKNEIWGNELELMLGYSSVWENLTDQNYPFKASEMLYKGTTLYRRWDYYSCWFTEKSPAAWESSGDGIINVSCGLAYVRRVKVT
jgi:hypothetical protein